MQTPEWWKPCGITALNSAELYGGVGLPEIAGAPIDAIEFYNAARDHRFMTRITGDIATLGGIVWLREWRGPGPDSRVSTANGERRA